MELTDIITGFVIAFTTGLLAYAIYITFNKYN